MTSKISSVSFPIDAQQTSPTDNVPAFVFAKPQKVILESNAAPAHLQDLDQKVNKQFLFMNKKRIDWFDFIAKCHGTTEQVAQLAQDVPLSSGPLSRPKAQQFSILEAEPAVFSKASSFIDALPSDQSRGIHAPILFKPHKHAMHFYLLFGLLQLIKVSMFITQLFPTLFDQKLTMYFSMYNLFDSMVVSMLINQKCHKVKAQLEFLNGELLKESSNLAVALPRMLVSECGHAKFFRRQVQVQNWLEYTNYGILAAQMFFVSVCYSVVASSTLKVYNIAPYLSLNQTIILFYIISLTPSVFQIIIFSILQHQCYASLQTQKHSIVANLRGFMMQHAYGLDYSQQHEIDEGICYIFEPKSHPMYVPFISVADVSVHLEPIRVKLTYKFKYQELLQFDQKNDRFKQILKRGFDQFVFDDVLVWVILTLQNEVKIWLPVSLTQLQGNQMFGFLGLELTTVLKLIKSQLEDQTELMEKLESVGQFCFAYQQMRQLETVEEAMHGDFADVVVVPVGGE